MDKFLVIILILAVTAGAFGQANIGISGTVEWDKMRLNTQVLMDLSSAGIRLPAGRTQGEALLSAGYLNLIQPCLLGLQVDSSSTIADLIDRGELTLAQTEAIALGANSVAPALSHDMRSIFATHSINLVNISSALLRHNRPTPVTRTLNPVSTANYTGIVIIAADNLPVHGMRGTALPVPCLFPKIWDSEMNLIYERSMLETRNGTMVRYSSLENIFANNPSGLSPELQQIVGERPLRIFASGVFGIKPTDLIIDRNDALLIISSEENRRLLSQGKVVFVLDDSVLSYEISAGL